MAVGHVSIAENRLRAVNILLLGKTATIQMAISNVRIVGA